MGHMEAVDTEPGNILAVLSRAAETLSSLPPPIQHAAYRDVMMAAGYPDADAISQELRMVAGTLRELIEPTCRAIVHTDSAASVGSSLSGLSNALERAAAALVARKADLVAGHD